MMTNSPVKNWRDTKKLSSYLGKKGRLLVWTKISTAPTGFEYQAPYFVGIVGWSDKKRMPVQIVDCNEEELSENMEVVAVVRRTKKPHPNDVIDYSIKVKPVF